MGSLNIAVAEMRISPDSRENSRIIQGLMEQAAAKGCGLIQFPEAALSGYAKEQIDSWEDIDWIACEDELEAIQKTAKRLGIWVVVGGAYRLPAPRRPHNSLFVISSNGKLIARYDKRVLSFTEQHGWYSPGNEPVVFEVNGLKIGLSLCIEIQFPELFDAYRRAGVDAVLISAYSDTPVVGVTARAHASINNMWVGFSTPINDAVHSMLIGPDGMVQSEAEMNGLAIGTIDPNDPQWNIPLKKARPWRQQVRDDGIVR